MKNKKKVLFVAHMDSHIQAFHIPYLKIFKEQGYEVHVASYGDCKFNYCDKKYNLPFKRNPLHIDNLIACKKLKQLIDENAYNIIHCHTPVGGVLARIANRLSCNYYNNLMIYTAHGFHFFSGAPILNWILYYPIERVCARFTDKLITINKEDYARAKKFKLKEKGTVNYVPGVGMDLNKIRQIHGSKAELVKKLNISENTTLLLSVGELNKNKNHKVIIQALPYLSEKYHYLICGEGPMESKLIQLAKKNGVLDRLHLLGYRDDVINIMKSCDIFVFPSKREGLSVALMEAKSCGLLCIASKIRGNTDLIINHKDGFVIDVNNFSDDLVKVLENSNLDYEKLVKVGLENVKKYSFDEISIQMKKIYGLEV